MIDNDPSTAPTLHAILADEQDRFIALWSQMGAQWGIPRTMAQVHALLYIAGVPMTADQVKDRLAISRGNASMTLRSLLDWGLVSRVHVPGERRERFEAEQDVWKLLQTVVAARKKRELEPLIEELDGCLVSEDSRVDGASAINAHNQRVESMRELILALNAVGEQLLQLDHADLVQAIRFFAGRGGGAET